MRKQKSALATLWGWITNLAAIAVLGWIAWYAYSQLEPTSSGGSNSDQGTKYNCRKALAERESDDACLESDSCTMTPDELTEMKDRQADIEEHCNLVIQPQPNVAL